MKKALKIDDEDNVATATVDILNDEPVGIISSDGKIILKIEAKGNIAFGHKIALKTIEEGEEIVKYGEVIGVASDKIMPGEWMHTHNVESGRLPTEGPEAGIFD